MEATNPMERRNVNMGTPQGFKGIKPHTGRRIRGPEQDSRQTGVHMVGQRSPMEKRLDHRKGKVLLLKEATQVRN